MGRYDPGRDAHFARQRADAGLHRVRKLEERVAALEAALEFVVNHLVLDDVPAFGPLEEEEGDHAHVLSWTCGRCGQEFSYATQGPEACKGDDYHRVEKR